MSACTSLRGHGTTSTASWPKLGKAMTLSISLSWAGKNFEKAANDADLWRREPLAFINTHSKGVVFRAVCEFIGAASQKKSLLELAVRVLLKK